ncbi:hypothetical protein RR47_GL000514 [Enterococcus columbae DSM 7374 = ATCC 51263]|nr:hypothetical protein RR47_GL000514 [Enterococcus columbae DSM 7374 = ATCC 51263]
MDGKILYILRFFQQLGLFTEYQLKLMPVYFRGYQASGLL